MFTVYSLVLCELEVSFPALELSCSNVDADWLLFALLGASKSIIS